MRAPRLLILDEPTSVLSPQAIEQLFAVLRQIASEGCSIIYISHKLDEVRALCHSATVLRAGRVSGTVDPTKATTHELAVMMVGNDLPTPRRPAPRVSDTPRLSVRDLSGLPLGPTGRRLDGLSFDVFGGEVVGIAGVSGNGQSELAACLSGESPSAPGCVVLGGRPVGALRPDRRRRLGLAYVPEERLGRGAVPGHSLTLNTVLTGYTAGLVSRGIVRYRAARDRARGIIEQYSVKADAPDTPASALSGGNLQKFILGRELTLAPDMLVVAQPTWGVDVGAAAFIRQRIIDLSRSGAGVLVFSEELDELLEICDRILVMSEGRLSDPVPREAATKNLLGAMMTGGDLVPGGAA